MCNGLALGVKKKWRWRDEEMNRERKSTNDVMNKVKLEIEMSIIDFPYENIVMHFTLQAP